MDLISEDEFLQRALNVPMQTVQWELAKQKGVDIIVRRDDAVDGHLSGNKFYKLFYHLQQARKNRHQQLLSFGGAYSNHLHALAAAGRDFGFKTIGVVRGERPKILSATLQDAECWGMQLHFVTRNEYSHYTKYVAGNAQPICEDLVKIHGDFYSIPEGGASDLGMRGAKTIGWAIAEKFCADYAAICLACGTGNTLAGVAAGIVKHEIIAHDAPKVFGFSVLKGDGDLGKSIINQQRNLGLETNNWRLISGYHLGGYGRKLPVFVQDFNKNFERETSLLLDPVYTLKMCWGVAQLLAQNYWPRGSRVILVHTGGLQGRRGFSFSE